MTKYLLAVRYDESTPSPSEEEFQEQQARTGRVTADMQSAGSWVFVGGLLPSHATTVVRPGNGTPTMTDGPFAETKELIAGFCLLQVKSKEEAIEWLKRAPFDGGTEVEIRQVFETADFAPSDPTGELRKKEQKLRETAGGQRR